MKKTEIDRISKKLGRRFEEVFLAVEELSKSYTILDYEKVLRICNRANNFPERWQALLKYLSKHLQLDGRSIADLLRIDPCFSAFALFNLVEVQSRKIKKGSKLIPVYPNGFSFISWRPVRHVIQFSKKGNKKREFSWFDFIKPYDVNLIITNKLDIKGDPAFFPESLTYEMLNELIEEYLDSIDNDKNLSYELTRDVFKRVGVLAFNVHIFRDILNQVFYDPLNLEHRTTELSDINALLKLSIERRDHYTKRNYWLIFVLVRMLVTKNKNTRQSCLQVASMVHSSYETVHRRYYDMKKEAEKKQYKLKDIIDMYGLRLELFTYQRQGYI